MIKRIVLLVFLACLPAHAAISTTAYVSGGASGGGVTSISTSAHSQAAHHCIAVGANGFIASGMTAPTDTAGDTFTSVVALYTGSNQDSIAGWVAYNVAGNASNVVTANLGSSVAFATVQAYDVDPGGNCTSTLLDIHAAIATTSSGTSASQTITTAVANEAILPFIYSSGSASFSAATVPTSFTANPSGITASYGYSASRIVSTIQTGVTLTWSSLAPSTTYDMFTISIEAVSAGGVKRMRGVVVQR